MVGKLVGWLVADWLGFGNVETIKNVILEPLVFVSKCYSQEYMMHNPFVHFKVVLKLFMMIQRSDCISQPKSLAKVRGHFHTKNKFIYFALLMDSIITSQTHRMKSLTGDQLLTFFVKVGSDELTINNYTVHVHSYWPNLLKIFFNKVSVILVLNFTEI